MRNDDRVQENKRMLTKSYKRLIYLNVSMQVTITINISRFKFEKLLEEVTTRFNYSESSYRGYTWTHTSQGYKLFVRRLQDFVKEHNDGNKTNEKDNEK